METESKSEITSMRSLFEKIKHANLSLDNYESYMSELRTNWQLFDSISENESIRYKEEIGTLQSLAENDDVKILMEQGSVPIDMFDSLYRKNEMITNIWQWTELERVILRDMVTKLGKLLSSVDAISIKNDTLKEMRESDKIRSDMIKDIVTDKFQRFDDKFDSKLMKVVDKMGQWNRDNLRMSEETLLKVVDKMGQMIQQYPQIGHTKPEPFNRGIDVKEIAPTCTAPIPEENIFEEKIVPPVEDAPVFAPNPEELSDIETRKMQETRDMKAREDEEKAQSNNDKIKSAPIYQPTNSAEAMKKLLEEDSLSEFKKSIE